MQLDLSVIAVYDVVYKNVLVYAKLQPTLPCFLLLHLGFYLLYYACGSYFSFFLTFFCYCYVH